MAPEVVVEASDALPRLGDAAVVVVEAETGVGVEVEVEEEEG